MANKALYVVVAVTGIGLASGAAWWLQNRDGAPPPVAGSGPGAAASGAPGVEVTRVKAIRLQDDAQAVGTLRSRMRLRL